MHKRKDTDMRRNKLLLERKWELVARLLSVLGIHGAGGKDIGFYVKGLL